MKPVMRDQAETFRKLHQRPERLVLPNAWDVATARLVEEAGFPAVATTSAGVAWALGYPDGERISRDEMLAVVHRIAAAVRVPVTADLEAGYGATPEAAARTARDAIAAGAIGLNLEDGTNEGRLLDASLHVERIQAVREAGAAAGAAGADCLFVVHVSDAATIGRLAREIAGPLNVIAGPPAPALGELARLGVRRASLGPRVTQAALGFVRRVLAELRGRGTYTAMAEALIPFADLQRLVTPAP